MSDIIIPTDERPGIDTTNCDSCHGRCLRESEIKSLRNEIKLLRKAVITDSLTGLFSKRYFMEALEKEFARTRRTVQPTSLILLDVDNFKSVNDTYGHIIGDKVLQEAAKILQRTMRIIDIPCRYGGEEFALILPSTPLSEAIRVAERLRGAIEVAELVIRPHEPLSITASFGVSVFNSEDAYTLHNIIEQADRQLYRAKKLGRNRVCSSESMNQRERSTQISQEERDALVKDPAKE